MSEWRLVGAGLVAIVVVMSGAASAPDLKSFMTVEVDPAANAFWAAGNDAPEGETPAQASVRWAASGEAATRLRAYGERLLKDPYRRDGEWAAYSKLMVEAGEAGEAAARQRSLDAAFEAGGQLYDACNGCHSKYIPGRA